MHTSALRENSTVMLHMHALVKQPGHAKGHHQDKSATVQALQWVGLEWGESYTIPHCQNNTTDGIQNNSHLRGEGERDRVGSGDNGHGSLPEGGGCTPLAAWVSGPRSAAGVGRSGREYVATSAVQCVVTTLVCACHMNSNSQHTQQDAPVHPTQLL